MTTPSSTVHFQREVAARRAASRLGFALRKSRRDGTYSIVDPEMRNAIVAGMGWHATGHGLDLSQVEDELRALA